MKRKLTKKTEQKYRAIIDEWFINEHNGTKAYSKFYSRVKPETAAVNFSRISEIPEIKAYINEKYEEVAKIVETTHKGILQKLKECVEMDVTEFIGLSPEDIKSLPISLKSLITKFKHTKNKNYNQKGDLLFEQDVIELNFLSKEKALEMINKHIGFYEKDNEQKVAQIDYEELGDELLLRIWDARKQP